MIELKQISKHFGKTRALENITFQLGKDEITAFIGPNGAGKTTTMKILTQTLQPSSGEFWVHGENILKKQSSSQSLLLRRETGYLAENNPLYPDMLTGEFLQTTGRLHGFTKKQAHSAMSRVSQVCHLNDVLNMPISNLSKGFRQRVGVAQALIHDPDLLILDEPTSGLDPNQTHDFLDMLKNLHGKTILFSTHILHSIPDFCHNLIFIDRGHLKFQGTPHEFMNLPQGPANMETAFRARTDPES